MTWSIEQTSTASFFLFSSTFRFSSKVVQCAVQCVFAVAIFFNERRMSDQASQAQVHVNFNLNMTSQRGIELSLSMRKKLIKNERWMDASRRFLESRRYFSIELENEKWTFAYWNDWNIGELREKMFSASLQNRLYSRKKSQSNVI